MTWWRADMFLFLRWSLVCLAATQDKTMTIEHIDNCQLPTQWGTFDMHGFRETESGKEHVCLVMGDPGHEQPVLIRVHSECLTGDALFSQRCDCQNCCGFTWLLILLSNRRMTIHRPLITPGHHRSIPSIRYFLKNAQPQAKPVGHLSRPRGNPYPPHLHLSQAGAGLQTGAPLSSKQPPEGDCCAAPRRR